MSFYTALTGLKGAQTDISTTSNNIANVGSSGFKKSRAEFGDIFNSCYGISFLKTCKIHAKKLAYVIVI